jgi:hypothetical protein
MAASSLKIHDLQRVAGTNLTAQLLFIFGQSLYEFGQAGLSGIAKFSILLTPDTNDRY